MPHRIPNPSWPLHDRFSDHREGQPFYRALPSTAQLDTLFNKVGGDPVLAPTGSIRGMKTACATVYSVVCCVCPPAYIGIGWGYTHYYISAQYKENLSCWGFTDVWYKNTYGKMTIKSVLTGWVDVPQTEIATAAGNSGTNQNLWGVIKNALQIAEQRGLSTLTNGAVTSLKDFDKNKYG